MTMILKPIDMTQPLIMIQRPIDMTMGPEPISIVEKHDFPIEAYFRRATLAKQYYKIKTILIYMWNLVFILGSSSVMQRVNVNCKHIQGNVQVTENITLNYI